MPENMHENILTQYDCSTPEVTNMWPAKEVSAAHKHFGETSTLVLSFPSLIFAMRYQKLSPKLNHARIAQESCKRTVQAFHLF